MDLQRAITVSSDVYFYKLGFDIWAARDRLHDDTALQNAASDLGFGQPTGIELPAESKGRLPTPAWLREYDRKLNGRATDVGIWTAGVNMNVAIGQGDVLATPLQVANVYASFANGGTLYRPSLVLKVTAPRQPNKVITAFRPRVIRKLQFAPGNREAMLAGFAGVTTDPGGTATSAFLGFNPAFPVAGKTGTAQVGVDPKTRKPRRRTPRCSPASDRYSRPSTSVSRSSRAAASALTPRPPWCATSWNPSRGAASPTCPKEEC